ncbi:MAG: phenylacetate--CoA ligase family protein [Solirubrobacterales bacterium]
MSEGSVLRRLGDAAGAVRHYRHLTSVGTPREELLEFQRRRLVETARHAAAASPFYRELYAGIELAEDLDVCALPIVTKGMLMEHFEEWASDPRLRLSEVESHLEDVCGDELFLGAYRCMPSGGTTGRKGMAYSSMASLLALEQLEGRLHIAPRVVVTTSEVRTEEMTTNIRAAWGVEPFDAYGTTEGFYAGDCERRQGMHVFEDLGLIEVVDEHGDPVPDGVAGAKLLLTSFIKRTQPLLRYEISDMVTLTTAPCPCGRPLARMASLEGRSDDILRMTGTDGRAVAVHPHVLKSPMAAFGELRQYKIIHGDEGLHVLVVLRDAASADEVSRRIDTTMRSELLAAGVADPGLDVSIVAELPREQGHSANHLARWGEIGVAIDSSRAHLLLGERPGP